MVIQGRRLPGQNPAYRPSAHPPQPSRPAVGRPAGPGLGRRLTARSGLAYGSARAAMPSPEGSARVVPRGSPPGHERCRARDRPSLGPRPRRRLLRRGAQDPDGADRGRGGRGGGGEPLHPRLGPRPEPPGPGRLDRHSADGRGSARPRLAPEDGGLGPVRPSRPPGRDGLRGGHGSRPWPGCSTTLRGATRWQPQATRDFRARLTTDVAADLRDRFLRDLLGRPAAPPAHGTGT